jgi:hypothetical protein
MSAAYALKSGGRWHIVGAKSHTGKGIIEVGFSLDSDAIPSPIVGKKFL